MCNFCLNTVFVDAAPNVVNPNYGVDNSGYVWTDPAPCCGSSEANGTALYDFGKLLLDSSNCSTPIEIKESGQARAEVLMDMSNGNAVICFETSIDGVNYYPYNGCSVLEITENTMVIVGDLDSKYYRVCVKAGNPKHTATTGSIKFNLLVNE